MYLWHFNDAASLRMAADWFDRAAHMPQAPNWLRTVAATTLAGADRDAARASLRDLAANADQVWLRRYAERTLRQLAAMDEIDRLQATVDRYREGHHGAVVTWTDLIRDGAARGIPVDPAGAPYDLRADGRVTVGAKSPLFPLPALRDHRDAR